MSEDVWLSVSQNLGLGVFEDRSNVHAPDQTPSDSGNDDSSSDDFDSSSEDSDGDSNSDGDISMTNDPALNTKSRLIKPLPKRAGGAPHPGIVVLDNATGPAVCKHLIAFVCRLSKLYVPHICLSRIWVDASSCHMPTCKLQGDIGRMETLTSPFSLVLRINRNVLKRPAL